MECHPANLHTRQRFLNEYSTIFLGRKCETESSPKKNHSQLLKNKQQTKKQSGLSYVDGICVTCVRVVRSAHSQERAQEDASSPVSQGSKKTLLLVRWMNIIHGGVKLRIARTKIAILWRDHNVSRVYDGSGYLGLNRVKDEWNSNSRGKL